MLQSVPVSLSVNLPFVRNFKDSVSVLEINEKIQSQFCDSIPKFSRNSATFSCRIFTLHFLVSDLAKQNMSPQFLCVKETIENGEWLKERNRSCI